MKVKNRMTGGVLSTQSASGWSSVLWIRARLTDQSGTITERSHSDPDYSENEIRLELNTIILKPNNSSDRFL